MMTPLEAPYTVLPGIVSDYKTPMGRVNIQETHTQIYS